MIEEDISGTSSAAESSEIAITLVGNEQMIEEDIDDTSSVAESSEKAVALSVNEQLIEEGFGIISFVAESSEISVTLVGNEQMIEEDIIGMRKTSLVLHLSPSLARLPLLLSVMNRLTSLITNFWYQVTQ